jgi:hypothetical protein
MLLNPTAFVPSAVQFDKSPLVGVPSTGVTSVGLVDRTVLPEPVEVVTPVPPFATGNVPVTPVDRGMFVTVLLAPLIVLLVSVLVLVAVRTLLGVMMFERFAMLYSG